MKSSFCIDLQRFMLIPTKFPLSPENFYEPQCEAQRRFLARYPDNATAADLIANQRHEAALFERYHEYYGYSFFIARKK